MTGIGAGVRAVAAAWVGCPTPTALLLRRSCGHVGQPRPFIAGETCPCCAAGAVDVATSCQPSPEWESCVAQRHKRRSKRLGFAGSGVSASMVQEA